MSDTHRRRLLKAIALGGSGALAGCFGGGDGGDGGGSDELQYVYPGYFGADAEDLVPAFEEQSGVEVSTQQIAPEAAAAREYYVNQFVAQSSDFDVGNMDIIWPGEFAANDWAAEMNDPENHTENMIETPVEAVTIDDTLYAMPIHTDANALYYRSDVLEEYGYEPPETYMELVETAQDIMEQDDEDWNGYVWQGGTNEGLTIMWLNWLWGMGGSVEQGEEIVVNSEEGVAALQHAVDLIHEYGVTPGHVPSSSTDENRETFQQGNTLFMRNWPYAVSLMNEEGSEVRGQFDVAPLPTHESQPDAANSCLGGWNVFINAFAQNAEAAQQFATFMSSVEAQEIMALEHSRLPVRREIYEDEEAREQFELLEVFEGILDRTQARPAIEAYPTFSEIVYTQANNALVQEKTPQEALDDAQSRIDDDINA